MKTYNYELVGGDTDGVAFKKPDQSRFTDEERASLLLELNALTDELINWEDDDQFAIQLVVKAKNYVLVDDDGKKKIKGSALKASMKEKALKEFVNEIIQNLVDNNQHLVDATYKKYVVEILSLTDISRWCSKHTITKSVLTGKHTTQVRIREALKGRPVQEGDKVYQFVRSDKERALQEDFDGIYDVYTLLGKLYGTLCIFETVLDVKQYVNYTLKKNKDLLQGLSNANL